MGTLILVLFYVLGALFLGALLSYPLHLWLQPIADVPFHRVVSRTGLLVALLGFPILVVYLRVASRQALGFDLSARDFIFRLSGGWLLGLLTILPVPVVLMVLDVRVPTPDLELSWDDLLQIAGRGLAGGLLVGLIEETLFRGALYAAIARRHSVAQAVILSSLLYAALHFIKPVPASSEGLFWASGMMMLWQGFWQLADPRHLVDSFLALFAAGVLLALVRRQNGHLAGCIGLHAGWVLIIKLTRHFTDRSPDNSLSVLAGSYDGVIGYLAAAWIGALCVAYGVGVRYWGKRVDGR